MILKLDSGKDMVYCLAEMLNDKNTERKIDLQAVLKALADGRRLLIVRALMDRSEICACQLIELLQVSGASTSRHLALLTRAGIIAARKEGRWVYYRLLENKAHQGLLKWLQLQYEKEADQDPEQKRLRAVLELDPEELCRRRRTKKKKRSCDESRKSENKRAVPVYR